MSIFHIELKKKCGMATQTDDITAGGGCGSMHSAHPLHLPLHPPYDHLPLMGTLHREIEEKKKKRDSNRISVSRDCSLLECASTS